MEELLSPEKNFKNYMSLLSSSSSPLIPWLAPKVFFLSFSFFFFLFFLLLPSPLIPWLAPKLFFLSFSFFFFLFFSFFSSFFLFFSFFFSSFFSSFFFFFSSYSLVLIKKAQLRELRFFYDGNSKLTEEGHLNLDFMMVYFLSFLFSFLSFFPTMFSLISSLLSSSLFFSLLLFFSFLIFENFQRLGNAIRELLSYQKTPYSFDDFYSPNLLADLLRKKDFSEVFYFISSFFLFH